jgi:hypothetical protein
VKLVAFSRRCDGRLDVILLFVLSGERLALCDAGAEASAARVGRHEDVHEEVLNRRSTRQRGPRHRGEAD